MHVTSGLGKHCTCAWPPQEASSIRGLAAELLCAIETPEVGHRRQFHLRQGNSLVQLCITPSIGRGGDGYMVNHPPLHGVLPALQRTVSIALQPGSTKVSEQTGGCRQIEQDEACSALQPSIDADGVVPFYDPLPLLYRLVVQAKKLFLKTGLPVGVRLMKQLIEVNGRQATLARNGLRKRRLAAVTGAQYADTRTQVVKSVHISAHCSHARLPARRPPVDRPIPARTWATHSDRGRRRSACARPRDRTIPPDEYPATASCATPPTAA